MGKAQRGRTRQEEEPSRESLPCARLLGLVGARDPCVGGGRDSDLHLLPEEGDSQVAAEEVITPLPSLPRDLAAAATTLQPDTQERYQEGTDPGTSQQDQRPFSYFRLVAKERYLRAYVGTPPIHLVRAASLPSHPLCPHPDVFCPQAHSVARSPLRWGRVLPWVQWDVPWLVLGLSF